MNQKGISEQLIDQGWSQGCLFSARSAKHACLTYGTADDGRGSWSVRHEALAHDDLLVVVSQTCDINNDKETYVEVVRAYWSGDRSELNAAETNSPRLFLLKRRAMDRGEEGLLADLRIRISIDKMSLLGIQPTRSFSSEADDNLRRFQRWLALRYQRPAIPAALVKAVQQPIANAVRKLSATHEVRRILRKVHEILILPTDFDETHVVDLAFMVSEQEPVENSITIEDGARLAGWIDTVLNRRGQARIGVARPYSYQEISARTLLESYRMPLSYISIEGEPSAPEL